MSVIHAITITGPNVNKITESKFNDIADDAGIAKDFILDDYTSDAVLELGAEHVYANLQTTFDNDEEIARFARILEAHFPGLKVVTEFRYEDDPTSNYTTVYEGGQPVDEEGTVTLTVPANIRQLRKAVLDAITSGDHAALITASQALADVI